MNKLGILALLTIAAALLLSSRGVRATFIQPASYEVIPPWMGEGFAAEFPDAPQSVNEPFPMEDYRAMNNPENNIAAFLAMIRTIEPDSRDPYRSLVGGGFASDLRDHPANIGWTGIRLANGLKATSAGAYQITQTTWNTFVQPRLHLPDFSPESQDMAGRLLLEQKRGPQAFAAVADGRFDDAIRAYRLEWEAFDRMLKGAYPYTLDQARAIYVQAGGTVT